MNNVVKMRNEEPPPPAPAAFPEALLRLPAACQMTGLSRSEIYRRMEVGRFPRPVQVSENVVAWRQSDIVRWIAELPIQPAIVRRELPPPPPGAKRLRKLPLRK